MFSSFKEIINGKQGTEIVMLLVVALCASIVHAIKKKYTFKDFLKEAFTTLFMVFLLHILLTYQFEVSIYIVMFVGGVCGMVSDVIYKELEMLAKECFLFVKNYLKNKIENGK